MAGKRTGRNFEWVLLRITEYYGVGFIESVRQYYRQYYRQFGSQKTSETRVLWFLNQKPK